MSLEDLYFLTPVYLGDIGRSACWGIKHMEVRPSKTEVLLNRWPHLGVTLNVYLTSRRYKSRAPIFSPFSVLVSGTTWAACSQRKGSDFGQLVAIPVHIPIPRNPILHHTTTHQRTSNHTELRHIPHGICNQKTVRQSIFARASGSWDPGTPPQAADQMTDQR